MGKIRWLLGLAVAAGALSTAHAQILIGPAPYGYARGGGISYSRVGPRGGLNISFGGYSAGYGLPPRGFLGPGWGPGYRGLTVVELYAPPPPPIVIVQRPPTIVIEVPAAAPPPADPGADPGAPPPVPREPDRRPVPPVAPPPKEAPPPKPEAPKKEPPRAPHPPPPADDPRDEYDNQMRLGREAFAAGEYGRAAQRFRRAARLLPEQAMPHFLLAQALLAAGKYHEANDAVHAGLRLDPLWPTARFRPADLYAGRADDYAEHLRALARALGRHPDDPVLLFLSGYAVWFDGRREDAARHFRRARPRAADRDAIDRFLKALPDPTL